MEGWGGVALMVLLGAGVGLGGLVISNFLGPKNPTPEKLPPTSAACRRSATRGNGNR